MNQTTIRYLLIGMALAAAMGQGVLGRADPVGTAFTYQGELSEDDTPVSGACDFEFNLYDAATDDTSRLRYVAGDDARQMIEARRALDDEAFLGNVRAQFGL